MNYRYYSREVLEKKLRLMCQYHGKSKLKVFIIIVFALVICIPGLLGTGGSGTNFNFSIFKALLKALHRGAKFVIK